MHWLGRQQVGNVRRNGFPGELGQVREKAGRELNQPGVEGRELGRGVAAGGAFSRE